MIESITFIYGAGISGDQPVLDDFAHLYGTVERKLFVDTVHRDISRNDLKRDYIKKYGITARHYASIRISVDAKINSSMATLAAHTETLKFKIASTKKKIANAVKAGRNLVGDQAKQNKSNIHTMKRKLSSLQHKLKENEHRLETNTPKLCFGTRKLFNSQFSPNRVDTHDEWKEQWKLSRSSDIFLVGSKDETCGNQTCQAYINDDESVRLVVRLPDALHEKHGKVFETTVKFNHGRENVLNAIRSSVLIDSTKLTKSGETVPFRRRTGVPLTYRFVKDSSGWRVTVAVPMTKTIENTVANGAVGVDINSDHVAVSMLDRHGNFVKFFKFPMNFSHKTANQRTAIIGDIVKQIAKIAKDSYKIVVLEDLKFEKEKKFSTGDVKFKRMLSTFAYSQILRMIEFSCFSAGVMVKRVNPAYTSILGNVNYSKRFGVSGHVGASIAIGRRGMNFREAPVTNEHGSLDYVLGDGHHVTLSLPVRNRNEHVWRLWSAVSSKVKGSRLEGYRCRKRRAAAQRKCAVVIKPIKRS